MAEVESRAYCLKRKPRQEISACLKWIVFITNFLIFLCGVGVFSLGVYLFIKDFGEVKFLELFLNPAIILGAIGCSISFVSLIGSLGALRDNITLLKTFAICVFFCYIAVVIVTFGLFVLFYSDTTDGFSAHNVLLYAIRNYHTNRNLAEIVDSLQENLECCGVSSVAQGYRDWNLSYQFNCTASNPQPEKCGVPFSCCRKSVISEAAGSSNPLLPAMRSLECWQNTLNKRPQDLEHDIYTRGCLQPLRAVFESHAIHIALVVAIVIIPVCVSVCLTNILARQIDHQHLLLEREARRNDRRRKRERHRLRAEARAMERLEDGKFSDNETSTAVKPSENPTPSTKTVELQNEQQPVQHQQQSTTAVIPSPPREIKKKKERRRRCSNNAAPYANARVQQWVLQQSDLIKPSARS
ncbi:unnamed protein product [Nippostrongylus brasiliensis]|uniref:Tetraspanin n=1 Tax=Nippostrongylus brasiliensis TaxID=27835 RepID=A0A0N4XVA8_NIPBR|nr:hypothetical protein Q1695_001568 [Nippostrongylus brasiliensis]VDL70303.1 unnamed protein product [Nippostrongylus brasiliensis]